MSEFRTVVKLRESDIKISYDSTLLFLGSCFSENIGDRFKDRHFSIEVNPFGVLYNPDSVKQGLEILLKKRLFDESVLFGYQGRWHSFFHHSRFSMPDKSSALEQINRNIIKGHETLKRADFLFITFGTAWVYENVDDGNIVANCHKLPASHFRRYRLEVEDIVKSYSELIDELKALNPDINIIFTVSPVRHLKDGAHGNQLSKSVLLLAVEELVRENENVDYFSAYELVMDDLRDYRFYAEDMVHPGKLAVDYIWDRLSEVYFDSKAKSFVKEIEKILKARAHRPFNKNGPEYNKFAGGVLERLEKLEKQFPGVDVEELTDFFRNEVNGIRINN